MNIEGMTPDEAFNAGWIAGSIVTGVIGVVFSLLINLLRR